MTARMCQMSPSTNDANAIIVSSIFLEECPANARGCSNYYNVFLIHKCFAFHFRSTKVKKRHETTLGKVKNVIAEGKSMKLVSDF